MARSGASTTSFSMLKGHQVKACKIDANVSKKLNNGIKVGSINRMQGQYFEGGKFKPHLP